MASDGIHIVRLNPMCVAARALPFGARRDDAGRCAAGTGTSFPAGTGKSNPQAVQ